MEQLLAHLVADIDRWEEQDEISAHAAADLRHYVGRVVVEHERAVVETGKTAWRQALDMVPRP